MTTTPGELPSAPEAEPLYDAAADTAAPDATPDATPDAAENEPAERGSAGPEQESLLVREGDVAGDYVERLLDIIDVDGDLDIDVEGGRAVVAVVGTGLTSLVGSGGETLDALQELTRLAVQQQTGVRSRLMLDVGGYRARRREELSKVGRHAADRVLRDGRPVTLEAMNPFERKIVHDAVAALAGVASESEGEEPQRRVIVRPAS